MRTLRFLLLKEFRQIFRNTIILRLIVAMPIIQLLILPLAADYEIRNINVELVDSDGSPTSRQLIDKIEASPYFTLTGSSTTFDNAFKKLESNEADLILEIPADFEKNLLTVGTDQVFLALNAINGTKAAVGGNYLGHIINRFNQQIRLSRAPLSATSSSVPQIDITYTNRFNPSLDYPPYMISGILVVLVTMVGSYMCALNIVKEKEAGTIEQINVTPIQKSIFILGKLIPFWIIGIFVFSIALFVVAYLIYGITPVGSIWVIYAYLSIYLIAVLGIGLIISTYSNTEQQAMSLAFFFMMIFILISGLFTSIDSMPTWARWIAYLNPVTYFIDVMRMVILKGSGFTNLTNHFLIMTGFAAFFNTWAILNYRKQS